MSEEPCARCGHRSWFHRGKGRKVRSRPCTKDEATWWERRVLGFRVTTYEASSVCLYPVGNSGGLFGLIIYCECPSYIPPEGGA